MPTWTYAKNSSGVNVNMFVGSAVTIPDVGGTNVEMVQETKYPWDGGVAITVNPAEAKCFAVRLRMPQRDVSELYRSTPSADGILNVMVNGKAVEPRFERGYAVIDREWTRGDKIEFEVPMKVQRVHASDKIASTRGRVALRYGPLVYNIESVDQSVENALAPDAELTTEWRPDLLDGVVVINGKFADGSPMTAIPNFARTNRDSGEGRRGGRSIVWIREAGADAAK
jgi:DUF1680 family protein